MTVERLPFLLASLAVIAFPLRPNPEALAHPPIGEAICQLERAVAKAYVAHDRAFLDGLFAAEFQHANFKGGVVGKREELDFFASPDLQMGAATIDSCAVRAYGTVAVATGVTTWSHVLFKGTDLSATYRFTRVYHHHGGRWQIVASHFSKIPPP